LIQDFEPVSREKRPLGILTINKPELAIFSEEKNQLSGFTVRRLSQKISILPNDIPRLVMNLPAKKLHISNPRAGFFLLTTTVPYSNPVPGPSILSGIQHGKQEGVDAISS